MPLSRPSRRQRHELLAPMSIKGNFMHTGFALSRNGSKTRSTVLHLSLCSGLVSMCLSLTISAKAADATLTPPFQDQHCAVISPEQAGQANPKLGISKGDLLRLASTNELNYRWVQWYIGSQHQIEDTLKSTPPEHLSAKIVKLAKCDSLAKFNAVINQSLYHLPKLECAGGDFNYKFRVLGNHIDMELVQLLHNPALEAAHPGVAYARRVTREPVQFVAGGAPETASLCPIRVTLERESPRALKMCLQDMVKAALTAAVNPGQTPTLNIAGAVSMVQHGQPIPANARQLTCKVDPEFAQSVSPLIKIEGAPHLVPGPAAPQAAVTQTVSHAQPNVQ